MQHLQERRHEEAACGDALLPAEAPDCLTRNGCLCISASFSILLFRRHRVKGRLRPCRQFIKICLRVPKGRRVLPLLIVQRIVISTERLRFQRLPAIGLRELLQKDVRRAAVVDDMVNIQEEIRMLRRLVNFHAIELIRQ